MELNLPRIVTVMAYLEQPALGNRKKASGAFVFWTWGRKKA
jgi:hypothetical protein